MWDPKNYGLGSNLSCADIAPLLFTNLKIEKSLRVGRYKLYVVLLPHFNFPLL